MAWDGFLRARRSQCCGGEAEGDGGAMGERWGVFPKEGIHGQALYNVSSGLFENPGLVSHQSVITIELIYVSY